MSEEPLTEAERTLLARVVRGAGSVQEGTEAAMIIDRLADRLREAEVQIKELRGYDGRREGFRAGMEKAAQVAEVAMAMNLDLRHFEVRCTSGSCPNCRVMAAIRAAAEKGE